jgi:hypothetical protein
MVTWSSGWPRRSLGLFLDTVLELVLVVQLETVVDHFCEGVVDDAAHGAHGRYVVAKLFAKGVRNCCRNWEAGE